MSSEGLSDVRIRSVTVAILPIGIDFATFQILLLLHVGLGGAQLASFAFAAVFAFFAEARSSLKLDEIAEPRRVLLWFVTLAMAAALFRGGVVALASQKVGIVPQLAIVPGIAASAAITSIGNKFVAFRARSAGTTPATHWRDACIAVCLFTFALKLVYIGQTALLPEEAYYWNYAQHPALGYLDHPPMVAWLITASTAVFGDNAFGVRFFAPFLWLVIAGFGFALARNLFGRPTAFVTVLLIAILPYFFGISFFMLPDTPLAAAWAAALYFFERAMLGERRAAWWGVGASIGLGLLSKYTIALLGPAALLFAVIDPKARRWFRRPEPYFAMALAAVLFTPVIVWGAQHQWASFVFQGSRRIASKAHFGWPALVADVLVLLTPTGVLAAILILIRRPTGDQADMRRKRFMTILAVVPIGVFVVFSVRHTPMLNWTGPAWLALLPAVAADIVKGGDGGRDRLNVWLMPWVRRAWPATAATFLVLYAAMLHYLVLGLPGIPGPPTLQVPMGWPDFGRQVASIGGAIARDTGKRPVFVGLEHYNLASEMAFYGRGPDGVRPDVDSQGLFGGKGGVMYQFWNNPLERQGRTLVLLSYHASNFDLPLIAAQCESLSPLEEHKVFHDGRNAGVFFERICRGYRASPF